MAPADLLDLARLRVAQVHGCDAEWALRWPGSGVGDEQVAALSAWRDAACFTPLQRAALALAEKMPWRHKEVGEADVAPLRDALGEARLVGFIMALGLFDATCRLRLALGVRAHVRRVERPAEAGAPLP